MKLKDISFQSLKINDKVLSENGIDEGKIIGRYLNVTPPYTEDNEIEIQWENGDYSYDWHFRMNCEYIGR